MSKSLKEMTVTEAASKALEVMHVGAFLESQEYHKEKGYWYDPDATWQDALREIGEYPDDSDDFSDLQDHDVAWSELKGENAKYTVDGLTAQEVDSYGGEGDGDQYWMVISISDGLTTRYFRKDGWYASHDGGYLDGETYEVTPKEKKVVVYE